ncbi:MULTISPECIES: TRAP transporter small permease [unclassified Microbulbifer]|uniref:TRAP transporter small permease n=1 Tax=unclassified Microbulbifer TaxID=2619833 RepID=UPI0027E3E5CC|nr:MULTISPECIES: TRAP transporter small permease [unclassified Microbulbifer]
MNRIEKLLEIFLGSLLALMVLDVTWQILTRFLPMSPSSYTEELARYLLVWIGLLGGAYAYRKKSHLGIDLLTNALPEKIGRQVQILTIFLCFAFAASAMVFGGVKLVALTVELNQLSAALNIPMGIVYSVIPLSGGLICLFSLDQLVQLLSGKKERIATAVKTASA